MQFTRGSAQLLLWFAILSAIGTRMHFDIIDQPNFEMQEILHQEIVAHKAPAPYQYRILQPMLVQSALTLAHAETGSKRYKYVFHIGYGLIRFVSILITLLSLYLSLRIDWAMQPSALMASCLCAFLPFTYRYYYYQPSSVLEMATFAIGLLCTMSRNPRGILVLVLVGTFNRETTCFLPLMYSLYWLPTIRKSECVWIVFTSLLWGIVFFGLRLLWAAPENLTSITNHLSLNLRMARENVDLILILTPTLLIISGNKGIPGRYLRLASCAFPWLILHLFGSIWYEIRFYMVVLIWYAPALMTTFASHIDGGNHHIVSS